MKKLFFNFLKIAVVSFILMMILSEVFGDVDFACAIVFSMIGLYVVFVVIANYIKCIKKYKAGEELPGYAKVILGIAMSIMTSNKSFHTHYTSVKMVDKSTDELAQSKESKIPIIVYTLTMFTVLSFVVFLFFLPLMQYTEYKDTFSQFLLATSVLAIGIALIISFLNLICNLIREMIAK